MYSIQHHWSGKTFALASSSDSEGKRTRIRRSKEERKALVESFIKKYQGLNDGRFPSLNLTHKEVGGSFYTVREIVRDVIQENRVLGPAKSSFSEQKISVNSAWTLEAAAAAASAEPGNDLFQLAIQVDKKENTSDVLDSGDIGQHAKAEVVDSVQVAAGETESGEYIELTYSESSESNNIRGSESDHPQKTMAESMNTDDGRSPLHENQDVSLVFNADQLGVLQATGEQTDSSPAESVEANTVFYADGASADSEKEYVYTGKNSKENDHEGLNDEHKSNSPADVEANKEPEVVEPSLATLLNNPRADVEANIEPEVVEPSLGTISNNPRADVEANKEPEVVEPSLATIINNPRADVEANKKPEVVEPSMATITNNPIADVVVETFPIKRVTTGTFTSDVGLDDLKEASNGAALDRTNPSDSVEQKTKGNLEFPLSDRNDGLVEQGRAASSATTFGSQEPVTVKEAAADPAGRDQSLEVQIREVEDSQYPSGGQVSGSPSEALTSKKMVANGPTLDRINLESWQGKSKNSSSELEKNPLVAFLKALVDGFLKFWSE